MPQSMIYCYRTMTAARIPSCLELLAFSVLTGKDLMGLPSYPGSVVSSLSGMPPALTHMPRPTQLLQPQSLEEWLTKLSKKI